MTFLYRFGESVIIRTLFTIYLCFYLFLYVCFFRTTKDNVVSCTIIFIRTLTNCFGVSTYYPCMCIFVSILFHQFHQCSSISFFVHSMFLWHSFFPLLIDTCRQFVLSPLILCVNMYLYIAAHCFPTSSKALSISTLCLRSFIICEM